MTTRVYIVGDSQTRVWGLRGRERLQRTLMGFTETHAVDDVSRLPEEESVVFLRGDHVFDSRVLSALFPAGPGYVLRLDNGEAVAACAAAGRADAVLGLLQGSQAADRHSSGLRELQLDNLALDYQANLSKNDPGYILPVNEDNRQFIETELFAGSYKGVTDLVTKWLWPAPARHATRLCVKLGLQPNHVTLLSLVLAITTTLAFWYGHLVSGLIMAWFMTFLDTVDGKLARVTITSSRLGDVLDHGLDLVHPPIWYLAWGVGLYASASPVSHLGPWMWALFLAYLGGRLCEGAFLFRAAPFPIFMWRPFDSFNRLITARRNPNLILLTGSLVAGRPELGFYAVAVWHLLSTLLLALRLMIGLIRRRQTGGLRSWLSEVDPLRDRHRLAVRIFTRVPAGRTAGD